MKKKKKLKLTKRVVEVVIYSTYDKSALAQACSALRTSSIASLYFLGTKSLAIIGPNSPSLIGVSLIDRFARK